MMLAAQAQGEVVARGTAQAKLAGGVGAAGLEEFDDANAARASIRVIGWVGEGVEVDPLAQRVEQFHEGVGERLA